MNASNRPRRLYRYVIDHDKGFAPNPFFKVCTLACCKPQVRQYAELGDVIMGYGPAKHDLSGHIIYWMLVDEITHFDAYWRDPRFRSKRPKMGGSLMLSYGDNIYHQHPVSGDWIQEPSFHSDANSLVGEGNLRRDTATTDKVLIGREYAYWGPNGPRPPEKFAAFIKAGRGHEYKVDDESLKEGFIAWLRSLPDRGLVHGPADWTHDKKLRQLIVPKVPAC
ncbi:MAG: hypothetical protein AAF224_13650 [Pseudomonadota bacterium]